MTSLTVPTARTRAGVIALAAWLGPQAVKAGTDPYSNLPPTVTLNGTCRDLRWSTETNGPPDFEYIPTQGYAHYVGIVADSLDSDGKPAWASTGYKVTTEARDRNGNNIMPVPKAYIQAMAGDTAGKVSSTLGGAVHTAADFTKWFRDVPGYTVSACVPITLVRQANSNVYSFSDKTDPTYMTKGGFFPIDGQLYGNSPGQSHNFAFTFELKTVFIYRRNAGQVFMFTGDDDVWLFINNQLVIDIGGVHAAVNQTIDVDRLGLVDGKEYPLALFFAERHTTQSNVRIDTSLEFKPLSPPEVTSLFD